MTISFNRIALQLIALIPFTISVQADGYWSTNGSNIVDSKGNRILFSGVNWNGFEASNCIVDGIWPGLARTYASHIFQMKSSGFNVIRLPFAGTCVQDGVSPLSTAIDFSLNPDLKGLKTVEAMKKIVQSAASEGLKVILDYHRRAESSSSGAPEDGLWFNATFSFQYWLDTWQSMAESFKNEEAVVGVDIWNEPHGGAVWTNDESNPLDFFTAAKKAAEAILSIQPKWLIFVEGISADDTWWGGNLRGVKSLPLTLSVPNKLVYSPHDYGPVVYAQPWFEYDVGFPSNLPAKWEADWGYIQTEGIAPLWIGEFGSKLNLTYNDTTNFKEYQWIVYLVDYIYSKNISWTYFTWGPNSGDTGGILEDGWQIANTQKLAVISKILYPSTWSESNTDQPSASGSSSLRGLKGPQSSLVVMLIVWTFVLLPMAWLLF